MKAATRGQRAALEAVAAMVRGPAPHAVLLTGPASSGKTTLALDLAAGLLCTAPDPAARPCHECRGCHQVASGNHPDLHRLVPEGPGGQIRIGKAGDPEPGTIRHLVTELALLPVEGGARVAIVEAAHRMNEDAQNALLKTLEEPPPGVTIVLCADDEERLLPTVRSRCVRVRLGTVAVREIEEWLEEVAGAEAPAAARAARLSGGRPGLALAYVRAADAARIRGEMARSILDLLAADRRTRLSVVRGLAASAATLNAALALTRVPVAAAGELPPKRRGRGGKPASEAENGGAAGTAAAAAATATVATATAATTTAADRRGAALTVLDVWASVARDLALAARGATRQVVDLDLLDDFEALAPAVDAAAISTFLARLVDAACQLDENANPELVLDVLALAWPRTVGPNGSGGPS